MYKVIILFSIIIIIIFVFYFKNTNKIIINEASKNYSECIKFMDNNWDIFESRFGKLNDGIIRTQLFPLIKEMRKSLKKNECIYDIGGNIGEITKMLNEFYPDNKIFTIEPLSSNFQELKKKFSNITNINIYNYAVGSFNGKRVHKTFGDGSTGDYLYPARMLNQFEVNFITTDAFYKKYCINFISITFSE